MIPPVEAWGYRFPVSGTGDSERAHDRAWQDIVDNYGDRAELDESAPTAAADSEREPEPGPEPPVVSASPSAEERFVPPPPPPLPRPEPRRAIAWAGVFGAPVVVLVALALSIDLPTLLDCVLIGWFVGGFLYLVTTMSRIPRDPSDDGSRI